MTSNSTDAIPVALLPGDGIGPEISAAVTEIVDAAGAGIEWIPCAAGERVFRGGDPTGLPAATIDTIRRCGVALKAPLATPLGGGERSANVRLRETFETFAAIRPAAVLPGLEGHARFPGVDLVLIRENLEDLYLGLEYGLDRGVSVALKANSQTNTRRICQAAFAVAQALGRRRVTGISKSNILKVTDGGFDRIFDEEAARWKGIEADRILVDAAACRLVTRPESFDVIVTSNLYGDILSDLTAGLVGGLGVCASINLGREVALFEAVHGTAPDIAGRNLANPTALLRAAVLLLDHVGRFAAARRIERALALVLREGSALTSDLAANGAGVSTSDFTRTVIAAMSRVSAEGGTPQWRAPSFDAIEGRSWPSGELRDFLRGALPTAMKQAAGQAARAG
ncbi:isocitrate/isopropylmalate family dehydrogenase [Ancylobacter mangrovi]|uniref:isocitrate/isopropylmalate family dehydrogenase n=1 Tax=Ancylobacter mangrovi TaxID=2972472 RepID=UPI0021623945|nr:isocitrate/isopropylmalate family dehydrogenase [Ancylobacter mangrovi]MCS0502052.1 isocitrate/isopropylmalate family dehydrogenase [Ancylobacter mangrovi]